MAAVEMEASEELKMEYRMWIFLHQHLLKAVTDRVGKKNSTVLMQTRRAIGRWLMLQQFEHKHAIAEQKQQQLLADNLQMKDHSTQEFVRQFSERLKLEREIVTNAAMEALQMWQEFRHRMDESDSNDVSVVKFQRLHPNHKYRLVMVGEFKSLTRPKNKQDTENKAMAARRHECLVEAFGLQKTAIMVLRYSALCLRPDAESGICVTAINAMYELGDARYEAFASPLNARLLGRPDAKFCSLFHDTDAAFGSMGNFFSINLSDHPGGWIVNPPWIGTIMEAAAQRIVDYVSEAADCWFFVTLPQWRDTPAWPLLDECEFKRDRIDFPAKECLMQDHIGVPYFSQTPISIFIVGDPPAHVDLQQLGQQLECRDQEVVKQAWIMACDRMAALSSSTE